MRDRFLVVDDVLLPLYKQVAPLHQFEKVIVFPFSGAPVAAGSDYESLLAEADPEGFRYAAHGENDPVAMCYTSAPPAGPRASPTRTAPPSCTRWWPAWATSGACAARTRCCR